MRISDWSSDVCSSDLPEEWYEALLTNAQAASNDRQWTTAYAIASRVDDAYAAGTDIRDQSLGERDDYTSLVWLAGTTAYYELKRPKDAMAMFQRYAEAARSPQTRSEEHTSELQSLMRISYAVFCLKKQKIKNIHHSTLKL